VRTSLKIAALIAVAAILCGFDSGQLEYDLNAFQGQPVFTNWGTRIALSDGARPWEIRRDSRKWPWGAVAASDVAAFQHCFEED
jgi:hypothetical protein